MSLAALTPAQVRLLQLACFALPVAAASLLAAFARRNRKYVYFRLVDEAGQPVAGVVSTIAGRGTRARVRAIGRCDAQDGFRQTFTPFEPQTLLITAPGSDPFPLALEEVSTPGRFADRPRVIRRGNGASVAD